jgi:hypothetical protein
VGTDRRDRHANDTYNVSDVSAAWLTLTHDVEHGVLYPPLYDGHAFGETRYMPAQILAYDRRPPHWRKARRLRPSSAALRAGFRGTEADPLPATRRARAGGGRPGLVGDWWLRRQWPATRCQCYSNWGPSYWWTPGRFSENLLGLSGSSFM